MQSPLYISQKNDITTLTYSFFDRASGLLSYQEIVQFGAVSLNTSSGLGGDPVLQIPNAYREAGNSCKIIIFHRSGAYIKFDGSYPAIVHTYCGLLGQIGSAGLKIDGSLSQFGFQGTKGVLDLSYVPESLDFSNLAINTYMDAGFNWATYSPAPGAVHRLISMLIVSIEIHGTN